MQGKTVEETVPIVLIANKAQGSYVGSNYINDSYGLNLGEPLIMAARNNEVRIVVAQRARA